VKYIDSYWWYGYAARSLGLSATRQQYFFSHNKSATSNQPAVLFSQNKPASAINHQPNEQTDILDTISIDSGQSHFKQN
jgi:hypothetical protein